jgi:aerobic carbon-monoxide dehydrogenase small subunit
VTSRRTVELIVNGRPETVSVEPRHTLADVLRHELGLTGTHIGCEHGICGSCTVVVDGSPARSCRMFAIQAEGRSVETVENLGTPDNLSPLQQACMDEHALQCGFCTPGFLMMLTAFLEENPSPTDEEIRDVVASNLCRCTGYHGLLRAVRKSAAGAAAPSPKPA